MVDSLIPNPDGPFQERSLNDFFFIIGIHVEVGAQHLYSIITAHFFDNERLCNIHGHFEIGFPPDLAQSFFACKTSRKFYGRGCIEPDLLAAGNTYAELSSTR